MALNSIQKKRLSGAILVVILILACDQASKVWVKTHMYLSESIDVLPWFKLYFTENPGMAFGIEIIDTYILTIFRFVIVCILTYFTYTVIKRDFKFGYIVCLAMVIAGALGNIIDCAFYGIVFDSSYRQVATFMPEGGGYSSFLCGRVVDMLYFPLIQTTWPEWMPSVGGREFVFFRPIFNIADSSICVSAFTIMLFYKRTLAESFSKEKETDEV